MAKPTTTEEVQAETGEKKQALEDAVGQIREKFGEGSIMKLKESRTLNVESIPTGSISLDLALGVGGIPRGRIIEIYGPESSGKTTLSMHMIAEVQKRKGQAAFVDAEHALDPDYAGKIGVQLDDLLISQPDNGEQALDIVETLVRSNAVDIIVIDSVAALTPRAEIEGDMGDSHMALDIVETLVRSNAVDIIVIDSVAALTPRAEIEGDMGDSHMGLHARLMSQALRKLTAIVSKSKTTVIFINQLRMKIGVMFGNPETTTGGQALKFYSSVRIEVRKKAQLKVGEKIIGNRVKVKIVKNKVAPPFRTTEFEKWPRRSAPQNLISCGMKAFPTRETCWTLAWNTRLSPRAAILFCSGRSAWESGEKVLSSFCAIIQKSPKRLMPPSARRPKKNKRQNNK